MRRGRKPKCVLPNLPDELLLLITTHLEPRLRDLNSLLLTSRVLHSLLTPVLYKRALGSPDRYGRSLMRTAAVRGNSTLVQQLLLAGKGEGLDAREPITGTTVLHAAVMMEHVAVVKVLLAHGSGIEMVDNSGWTPLHWAALSGNCGVARALLAHGAKCFRAGWRTTPLHLAAANGNREMVEALMDHGAGATLKDRYRVSAIDHAVAGGWRDLAGRMGGRGDGGVSVACRTAIMVRQETANNRWEMVTLAEEWYARPAGKRKRRVGRRALMWLLLM